MGATEGVLEERIRRAVRCEIFRTLRRAVAGLVITKLLIKSIQMKAHVLLFGDVCRINSDK